jgi:hypothetical protein
MRSAALALSAAAVVAASLWYLQAPPRSPDAYAERAADTAATMRSQVETARIWAQTVADGETLLTSARVGLAEADTDASTALSDFEELDPPAGTTHVRDTVAHTGGDAVALLAALRIDAHHGQWARVESRRAALRRIGARLERLERKTRP